MYRYTKADRKLWPWWESCIYVRGKPDSKYDAPTIPAGMRGMMAFPICFDCIQGPIWRVACPIGTRHQGNYRRFPNAAEKAIAFNKRLGSWEIALAKTRVLTTS